MYEGGGRYDHYQAQAGDRLDAKNVLYSAEYLTERIFHYFLLWQLMPNHHHAKREKIGGWNFYSKIRGPVRFPPQSNKDKLSIGAKLWTFMDDMERKAE
mgnify:CR=1 FL=1